MLEGEHPQRLVGKSILMLSARWWSMGNRSRDEQVYYRIRVRGELDFQWSEWFDGMIITHDTDGNSTLGGSLADQSALYGLLDKARDLGLILVSVTTEAAPQPNE